MSNVEKRHDGDDIYVKRYNVVDHDDGLMLVMVKVRKEMMRMSGIKSMMMRLETKVVLVLMVMTIHSSFSLSLLVGL